MIQTTIKTYTFEDYLNYQDNSDRKYELFNGELFPIISMGSETGFLN